MTLYRAEFIHDGQRRRVVLTALGASRYRVQVDEVIHDVEAWPLPDGRVRFWLDGTPHEALAAKAGALLQVRLGGRTFALQPATGRGATREPSSGTIEAPMTGTVIALPVQPGQRVEPGETVAVLSAMKIEHKLTAGIAGTLTELAVEVGQTVDQGAVVARIE